MSPGAPARDAVIAGPLRPGPIWLAPFLASTLHGRNTHERGHHPALVRARGGEGAADQLAEPLIQLSDVTKRYEDDGEPALQEVNLTVARVRRSRSWAPPGAASPPCST